MPLFDYTCLDCGETFEVLISNSGDSPECSACGSSQLKKLLAAPSSMSGPAKSSMPGFQDTACCGSRPGEASGCAGPGSCCGKM